MAFIAFAAHGCWGFVSSAAPGPLRTAGILEQGNTQRHLVSFTVRNGYPLGL